MPTVRVVIVDYSGEEVLPKCIESLNATIPPEIPVTVIDNASPTPSESIIPRHLLSRVDIDKFKRNLGYAWGIAHAWEEYSEDYLVLANNDIEFKPGWLEELIEKAEKSGAHAVSAVIEHENESELEKSTNASLNPLLYLIPGVFKDRTKAVYPSGACFLLRNDKTLPFAPVDFEYFMYYEDVYIGFFLRSLGKTVLQCPEAKVGHVGSHAVGKSNASKIAFYRERNRLLTMVLFFDFKTLSLLSPWIFIDSLFKIPQCLISGKPVLATIIAHWWILFHASQIGKKKKWLHGLAGFEPGRIIPYLTHKIIPSDFPGGGFFNAISRIASRIVGLKFGEETDEQRK